MLCFGQILRFNNPFPNGTRERSTKAYTRSLAGEGRLTNSRGAVDRCETRRQAKGV